MNRVRDIARPKSHPPKTRWKVRKMHRFIALFAAKAKTDSLVREAILPSAQWDMIAEALQELALSPV
jgi:hypothetical protein